MIVRPAAGALGLLAGADGDGDARLALETLDGGFGEADAGDDEDALEVEALEELGRYRAVQVYLDLRVERLADELFRAGELERLVDVRAQAQDGVARACCIYNERKQRILMYYTVSLTGTAPQWESEPSEA